MIHWLINGFFFFFCILDLFILFFFIVIISDGLQRLPRPRLKVEAAKCFFVGLHLDLPVPRRRCWVHREAVAHTRPLQPVVDFQEVGQALFKPLLTMSGRVCLLLFQQSCILHSTEVGLIELIGKTLLLFAHLDDLHEDSLRNGVRVVPVDGSLFLSSSCPHPSVCPMTAPPLSLRFTLWYRRLWFRRWLHRRRRRWRRNWVHRRRWLQWPHRWSIWHKSGIHKLLVHLPVVPLQQSYVLCCDEDACVDRAVAPGLPDLRQRRACFVQRWRL